MNEVPVATPIRKVPSYCAQCRSRCGCLAVIEEGKLSRIEPLPDHPTGAKLCPKGRAAAELVYHPDRITQPLRRRSAKGVTPVTWQPVSWDTALDDIAANLAQIRDQYGAEQTAFSVTTPSGTHISDGIAWIERFIRAYGSPNTIYGTEICNWHKDVASRFTYGFDIGTPDFANTDCVLLWGNNPSETWLARSLEIQKARQRGAKLIVVDPRPTIWARRADCWLRVKPGTDQALALALANLLTTQGRFNQRFIKEWSNGPFLVRTDTGRFLRQSDIDPAGDSNLLFACAAHSETLLAYDSAAGQWQSDWREADLTASVAVQTLHGPVRCQTAFTLFDAAMKTHPLPVLTAMTGVPVVEMQRATDILSQAASVAYYAWNGVGQSPTATQTDRALSLLYSLTGHYGAPGGNVPGSAAPFADISGTALLPEQQRAKALGLRERPLGPPQSGWVTARDVYRAVLQQDPYPVRMLFSFGGNLLSAQPDIAQAKAALQKLAFHVHADFFVNASAAYADYLLPVATSWEREALRPGFDASVQGLRHVQLRQAVIPPVGEARSDIDIVLALAERLGMAEEFFGGDKDRGHDAVLAPAGLSCAQLRLHPEGVTLTSSVSYHSYATENGGQQAKGFPTPTRKLEIYSETLLAAGYDAIPHLPMDRLPQCDEDFPLTLSGAKTVAFCHSQHRNIPSLRRLAPDPVLQLSPDTAAPYAIRSGDWVQVSTKAGIFKARAQLLKDAEPGSVFAQHGWCDEVDGSVTSDPVSAITSNVNQTIASDRADPISGSLPLRCTACRIEKIDRPNIDRPNIDRPA